MSCAFSFLFPVTLSDNRNKYRTVQSAIAYLSHAVVAKKSTQLAGTNHILPHTTRDWDFDIVTKVTELPNGRLNIVAYPRPPMLAL